jgi:hypothetical protein
MKYSRHYFQLMVTTFATDSPALKIEELMEPTNCECVLYMDYELCVNVKVLYRKHALYLYCKYSFCQEAIMPMPLLPEI